MHQQHGFRNVFYVNFYNVTQLTSYGDSMSLSISTSVGTTIRQLSMMISDFINTFTTRTR